MINQYFPPDNSATASVFADLCTALVKRGHKVRVICGRPSYGLGSRRRWRLLAREDMEGVRVERIGSTAFHREGMKGRVANYVSFMVLAILRCVVSRRSDVVIAGSDPPLAIWAALSARRGAPIVYCLQDFHPEHALASGMIGQGVIVRAWEKLHKLALRRCDVVATIGSRMKDRVIEKGVAQEKVVVIPNGAWPSNGLHDDQIVEEIRGSTKFLVIHAGNLGGAGSWQSLVAAARRLPDGVELLFVGGGLNARAISGRGVRVVGFRPSSEIASVMAAGDIQVVTLRRGMEGVLVPSKIYTILAHGRPVLAVVPDDCEVADIITEYECGLLADPDDPEDIAVKIEWAVMNPDSLRQMANNSLKAASNFHRGRQLDRYINLIEATGNNLGRIGEGGIT